MMQYIMNRYSMKEAALMARGIYVYHPYNYISYAFIKMINYYYFPGPRKMMLIEEQTYLGSYMDNSTNYLNNSL